MGTLKPNVEYVYEQVNGITYGREVGSDPSTRKEIGWDYDPRTNDGRPLFEHIQESKLWGDIHRAAKTNSTLQEALERVKITYYLTKDYKTRYGKGN